MNLHPIFHNLFESLSIIKPKAKLRPDTFEMFWNFFHQYSYVNKINKRTSLRIWNDMPQHKKDRAYSLDTVLLYRKRHLQCDEYLTEVNKTF